MSATLTVTPVIADGLAMLTETGKLFADGAGDGAGRSDGWSTLMMPAPVLSLVTTMSSHLPGVIPERLPTAIAVGFVCPVS